MKNFCIALLMGFLLLSSGNANSLGLLGHITNIVAVKTSGLEVSFDLPKEFISADGQLNYPMQVCLQQNGQNIYKTQLAINHLVLPNLNLKQGVYYLVASINGHSEIIRLTIQ